MLRTKFLRDGMGRIIGSTVEGYSDGHTEIRSKHGQIIGRTVPGVGTKTSPDNRIISRSTEVGFLFSFDDEEDQ